MTPDGSITRHLRDLEDGTGQEDAARAIWERFFGELARHCAAEVADHARRRRAADEEDAAACALADVCRAVEAGRLKLEDRVDLRKVLLVAAAREAIDQHRHEQRGGVRELGGDVLADVPGGRGPPTRARCAGGMPAPARPARRRPAAADRRVEARRPHQRGGADEAPLLPRQGRARKLKMIRSRWAPWTRA